MSEYGYGFYFRFLTRWPRNLWAGKNEAWYNLCRMTNN